MPTGQVGVKMTLTAPACPAAQSLPVEVRDKARSVEGVTDAKVEVVWDPPWTKDRMSDAAKLELGMLVAPGHRPHLFSQLNRRSSGIAFAVELGRDACCPHRRTDPPCNDTRRVASSHLCSERL